MSIDAPLSFTASGERRFPEPMSGEAGVMGVDVHRHRRAEVGCCARNVAPVSTALATEVQGCRLVDRIWAQLQVAAPALLSLFMVAPSKRCPSQVVLGSAAGARIALEIGKAGQHLIGELAGFIDLPQGCDDPRRCRFALEAELGIAREFVASRLDVGPGVVSSVAFGFHPRQVERERGTDAALVCRDDELRARRHTG